MPYRTIDVAFHSLNDVGTRDEVVYGAQYWACMYPCRCDPHRVATVRVRLGASVSGKDFANAVYSLLQPPRRQKHEKRV